MKKSTDESPKELSQEPSEKRKTELLVDVIFSEGGFSLLVIFPLVVFYFLSMALSSV